jgi:peptidyl-tRNA hydrolase
MSSTRMVIVVRRDLNMTPGLLASQVSHISMRFLYEAWMSRRHEKGDHYDVEFSLVEGAWIEQPYLAVLAVDTPEELELVRQMAVAEGLDPLIWKDVIPSKVFEGRVLECIVGIAIGPADSDKLRLVTGTLPLY